MRLLFPTFLLSGFISLATAQTPPSEPEPKVEIRPAVRTTSPQPPLQIRPASLKQGKSSPSPTLNEKEQKIIQNLSTMNVEQVRELGELYNRMGNGLMTSIFVAELTRRNPQDPMISALQMSAEDNAADDDPEATQAQELYAAGKVGAAADLLKKLKAEKYRGQPFRYQQDLAYALLESGRPEEARQAFHELLKSSLSTSDEKSDAQRSLASMALEALQSKGHDALNSRDARRALQVAEQLLTQNPADAEGIALKAEALSLLGRNQEAITWLQDLKSHSRQVPFPHQKTLADTYYDAHLLDSAESAYQEIVAEKTASRQDRTEAVQRLVDLRRDRLILAGETALNKHQLAEAESIATQLEKEVPVSSDALAFRAEILSQQRRFAEAAALLEKLQRDPRQPFNAHAELGQAYLNTGRWQQAAGQFAVAENNPANSNAARYDAARLRREMLARYRPTVSTEYAAETGAEGTVWRATIEASTGIIGDGHVFIVRGAGDQIHLADSERIIARQDATRAQAELAYRRIISNGFFGEASVGGSDDHVTYGAKVGRYEGPGLAWELSYQGNERATDSLTLEALNGRQNTLGFYLSTHFSRRFYLDARAFFRQVHVQDQDLGQGWGFNMNVGWSILEETARRPELQISYFNEISYFNSKTLPRTFTDQNGRQGFVGDLESQLIDKGINRHGIMLTLSKQLTRQINAYLSGGVSYEFENSQQEARFGAGIEAYLAPNASLNLGVDYGTSGNTGNRGSEVISGTVGVKMSF